MPDAIDRLSILADRLIDSAEAVSAQMKLVSDQLHELLMSEDEILDEEKLDEEKLDAD